MKKKYLFVALFLLAACGSAKKNMESEVIDEGEYQGLAPALMIHEAEDKRQFLSGLSETASMAVEKYRVDTALCIGRIGDPAGADVLMKLLNDPVYRVRDAAAFAVGLFGKDAPKGLIEKLGAGLETGTREAGTVARLDALGVAGGEESLEAVLAFVEDERTTVRVAAVKALGLMGQRGVPIDAEWTIRVASYLEDENETVRFMAAFFLFRAATEDGPGEVIEPLRRAATRDESFEVRAYAYRALSKRDGTDDDTFKACMEDADPAVSATAASLLSSAEDELKCHRAGLAMAAVKNALEKDPLKKDPYLLEGAYIRTVRAVLEAMTDCSVGEDNEENVRAVAKKLDEPLAPESAGVALCVCLAKLLLGESDVALVGCDPGRPYLGKHMLLRSLAKKASIPANLDTIVEMVSDADPRVSTRAVSTLGKIDEPRARLEVIGALESDRPLVVAAALDVIAGSPEKYKNITTGDGENVVGAVSKVASRFAPFDNMEGQLISAVFALKALKDPASQPVLEALASDKRPAIRGVVLEAYAAIEEIEAPKDLPETEPIHPVPFERIKGWNNQSVRAEVRTSGGVFTIALFGNTAPATVDNFVSLAKSGYFNGTEFHRVVPNFVVQGGDPTGTGMGDPGYTIRCELNDIPYVRGVVGMALAGKDTGGSQFFVTLSKQPHLTGKYTVFGKVTSGMEVVDALEQGDAIEEIEIILE